MNLFTKSMYILLASYYLTGCTSKQCVHISVSNPTNLNRNEEMIEIPMKRLQTLHLKENEQFVILNSDNQQIPYQITYDSLLIFPVSVNSQSKAEYIISIGTPDSISPIASGKQYPERFDDLAWENDKAAYRAYGPALQAKGERSFGYDVFTKSVPYPVVEHRYRMETDIEAHKRVLALREQGKTKEADSLFNALSYHVDHGNGMDCYSVGATLGGGTAALMTDSTIIYPYCYRECNILDNGPLRFTVKLTYTPITVKNDSNVIETRIITLDKGSHLNQTEIRYSNLSHPTSIASGIVIHPQNPDGYKLNTKKRYIAYADSTDNTKRDNGVIYLGVVFCNSLQHTEIRWFTEEEKPLHPGALGHILGISSYKPDTSYIYYWGSGWSKGGIKNMESWEAYLKEYAYKIEDPLQLTIQ